MSESGSSNSLLAICFARGLQVHFFILRKLNVSCDGYLPAHVMRRELSRLGERRHPETSSLNHSGSYGHQLPPLFFSLCTIMYVLGVFRALMGGNACSVPVCRKYGSFEDASDCIVPA